VNLNSKIDMYSFLILLKMTIYDLLFTMRKVLLSIIISC